MNRARLEELLQLSGTVTKTRIPGDEAQYIAAWWAGEILKALLAEEPGAGRA